MKFNKNIITHITVLVFALLFLFLGHRTANQGLVLFDDLDEMPSFEARVTEIIDIFEEDLGFWGTFTTVTFEARLRPENITVTAFQTLDLMSDLEREVAAGDRVILVEVAENEWYFLDFIRLNNLLILGGVFVVLLLIFGRAKGLNAIISLGLTCVAIFAVFIPSILTGRNIYLWAIMVCLYSMIVTLFLVYGINKKSAAALAGCIGGVIAASIITLVMSEPLLLTGMVDGDSVNLIHIPTDNTIDLIALVFAGIIIGAVGAVIDVAVSISSAMWELKEQAPDISFKNMLRSGLNVGRDIMGSMTNTLVLAYIGGSLSIILILVVYSVSFTELINMEMVIVEILQAVVGSMGILLTMPLTALVCAALFVKKSVTRSDK